MTNLCIEHNALDTIQFYDVINSSLILKRYLNEGKYHFESFDSLLEDIFYIHFKHSLYFISGNRRSVNCEIIYALLNLRTFSSVRKRTVGSKVNTYLALKLLLDGLYETLRGRSTIESMTTTIQKLNDFEALKSYHETLKSIASHIDLEKLLTTKEQTLLSNYLETFNTANTENISPNVWLTHLVDVLFDTSTYDTLIELNKTIENALKSSPLDEEISKTQTLLEQIDSKKEDENALETENQSEIDTSDDATSDDFKEQLKEELEERFAPYLKDQFLVEGQNKSDNPTVSEIDQSESTDKNIIQKNKVDVSDQSIQEKVHKLSKTQENQLRENKAFGQASQLKRLTIDDYADLESEINLTEQTLKEQIKNLNLPKILSKAIEGIDTFSMTTKTLGIKANALEVLSFDEVIQMQKRYKKPAFIKFVNKVGKNKIYASKIQHQKKKEHAIPIDKISSSHNIDLLIEDEYIGLALGIEAFENDFYDRYLRDDLLTIDMIRKYDRRKGPIILCYDGSGSMEGAKIEETQSHILSIMEIARIQKRHLVLIQFASASEPLYIKEINPVKVTAQDILDVLDEFICGGTDFEKPLSKAIEYIKADQHKKSDILFITDGQCEIRAAFKEEFLQLKQARDFKLYTIIMHAYTYHDYGDIGDISDEVLEIKGRDIGNWNEATNKKLYSLI